MTSKLEVTSELLLKYPFTKEAKAILRNENKTLKEVLLNYPEIIGKVREKIFSVLHGGRAYFREEEKNYLDFLSYPLVLAVIYKVNDENLLLKFAVAESKRLFLKLMNEREEIVLKMANETFNLPVLRDQETNWGEKFIAKKYYVPMEKYLAYSKKFRDTSWKLINRNLMKGFVELNKRELIRLISEAYKVKIIEGERNVEVPKELETLVSELKEKIAREKFLKGAKHFIKRDKSLPPCIQELLEKAKKGFDLSHVERLVIATFLLNRGYDIEETVKVFSELPDFSEEKTRYQVEHLSGLKGSKTKYSPPSCETLKAYGICRKDESCKNVKHPLQYK